MIDKRLEQSIPEDKITRHWPRIWNVIAWLSVGLVAWVVIWLILSIGSTSTPRLEPIPEPIPAAMRVWETQTTNFNCVVVERNGEINDVQCFQKELSK